MIFQIYYFYVTITLNLIVIVAKNFYNVCIAQKVKRSKGQKIGMLSSYRDYWDDLPICDDLYDIIKEPLKDGVTFQIPSHLLWNLNKNPHYAIVPRYKIYCYKNEDIYHCKVTNDVRREILRNDPSKK